MTVPINRKSIVLIEDIGWEFRKLVIKALPNRLYTWLSKSFANFADTAHQLHMHNALSSNRCGVCNAEREDDTLHILVCRNNLFSQWRNEKTSILQLQTIGLIKGDVFHLCLLEWILDISHDAIE